MIGVDVARFGDDKSALFFRHGRDGTPRPYERYAGLDTMALAGQGRRADRRLGPGRGLRRRGRGRRRRGRPAAPARPRSQVIGVNFGGKADRGGAGAHAGNKRSEMWLSARDWLQRGSLPKDELLAAELTAPMYSYNAANALMLEPKADMKRRGIPSPDVADAFALTFAYNVARWEEAEEPHLSD